MTKEVAIVTGGTGDIGTAICKKLSSKGCTVIALARESEESSAKWLASVEDRNISYRFMDVADFSSCVEVIQSILTEHGQIDILVNAAGICRDTRFQQMSKDDWEQVLQVDLHSVFNVSKRVVDSMVEKQYGRIVNISSINGLKGQFGQVNYSAAKAGIYGFTKALAQEMGRKGVTVNSVSPGYIDSSMVMGVPDPVLEKLKGQSAVGRLGKPEEVARLVAFLSDKESGFITGANYTIDGGLYMY